MCEAYFAPYGPDVKHTIFSQTKSFMATALGLAWGEGLLSPEDRVLPYFPEVDERTVPENGKKMRIRDLLAMAGGQDSDSMEAFRQGGPAAYFAQSGHALLLQHRQQQCAGHAGGARHR